MSLNGLWRRFCIINGLLREQTSSQKCCQLAASKGIILVIWQCNGTHNIYFTCYFCCKYRNFLRDFQEKGEKYVLYVWNTWGQESELRAESQCLFSEQKRLLTTKGWLILSNTWLLLIITWLQYAYWRTWVRLGTNWSAPVKYWCHRHNDTYFPFLYEFIRLLLKHIPQPSGKPLYIGVLRQVHGWQTCTYHVPNIYLNMYLLFFFYKLPYIFNKVYDEVHVRYMLGICSSNIYPIHNPYV